MGYWSHLLTFVHRAVNSECRMKGYSEKDGGRNRKENKNLLGSC